MEVEEAEDITGGGGGEGEDSEGKRLAEVVKATHRLLRAQYKEAGGGAGAGVGVWREHVGREEHLQRYAKAMHTLATQYWPSEDQASISRVGWVRHAVREYFWGGGMLAATNKEMRKLGYLDLTPDQPCSPGPPPPDGTIRVLDVGSCYNPFSAFAEFEVTAIDLCPAHESVLKGDFLNLDIVERGRDTKVEEEEGRIEENGGGGGGGGRTIEEEEERKEENGGGGTKLGEEEGGGERAKLEDKEEWKTEKHITEEEKGGGGEGREDNTTITTLTASSYDVIVFSLVLEYLPAPAQRYECCVRAWRLLTPGGVLAIVTPDSRHQGANAHLYQLWRVSLAGLGFGRVKYEKQAHFHGFLFRKGLCRAAWQSDAQRFLDSASSAAPSVRAKLKGIDYSKVHQEMYIPQDFEEEESGKCTEKKKKKRKRKECDKVNQCKKRKKNGMGEEGEREESGGEQCEGDRGTVNVRKEETEGRVGEMNGKREREDKKEEEKEMKSKKGTEEKEEKEKENN